MKYTVGEKLSQTTVSAIIARGWEAEARRDIDGAIENFAPIWPDVNFDPDFSDFAVAQQAVLYRLAGFFLSIYGNVRSLRDYQERAKNLLCQSSDLFNFAGDRYSSADARNVLALCYINEGAVCEGEIILEQVADELAGDHLHPVYLRNRVNLLIAKRRQRKYDEALRIIDENLIPIEFCQDFRVCCLFHEKAGVVYRGLGQYEKAVWHYHESIRFAYKLDNLLFVSSQRNNLAFLYNKIKNFELAHASINEAIKLAKDNNFRGALPSYLDTQALIFANEGFPERALMTINEAIRILENSDDYFSLTEAIWNKCRFLLQLDRKEEALMLFAELIPMAGQRMGEFAVKQFTREFSEMIHVKQEGISLDDELRRFKYKEVSGAMQKANFNLRVAAATLNLEPANLSRILDKEFPDLYRRLDGEKTTTAKPVTDPAPSMPGHSVPRTISPLLLSDVQMTLDGRPVMDIAAFYIAAELSEELFGREQDAVAAVSTARTPAANSLALIFDPADRSYFIEQVRHDESLNLLYVSDRDGGFPVFLDELEVVGEIVGCCPFSAIDQNVLAFSSIDA